MKINIRKILHRFFLMVCVVHSINISVTYATRKEDSILQHLRQTNIGADEISRRKTRNVRLYSKLTGDHIQILGKKIRALGGGKDEYSKLLVISDSLGGRVRIQGEKTGYYLCMTPSGKLVGRKRFLGRHCAFQEGYTPTYYNVFSNVQYPNWYISFNRRGHPKRGPRTSRESTGSHFVKRDPPKPVVATQPTPLDVAIRELQDEILRKYRESRYQRSWRRIRRHRFSSETPKWTRQTLSMEERLNNDDPPEWLFAPATDMSPQLKMEWLQNVNLYLDTMNDRNMGFPTLGPFTQDEITFVKRRKNTHKRKKNNRHQKLRRKDNNSNRKRRKKTNAVNYNLKHSTKKHYFVGSTVSTTTTSLQTNLNEKKIFLNAPKKHKSVYSKKSRKKSRKNRLNR